MIRLGTWLPFDRVPRELEALLGVPLGAETVRRRTEAAGTALVAAETAVVERLERTWRRPPRCAVRQQVSVDGAMVPLVHGQWAEVKTLAIGHVVPRLGLDGTVEPAVIALSYFSRLADADTFRRLAWVETHRRGTTLAADVCGPVDGSDWCQHFLDWHCPDALRILDFPHAGEHLATAARSVYGAGTDATTTWLKATLHTLKHGDPEQVLAALRALPLDAPTAAPDAAATQAAVLQYLEKRRAQIQYAAFQAAGYPIGSGLVESANKLVVEARLKGSGMHWARPNVNPMVALRAAACSDRWAEAWDQIAQQRRIEAVARRAQRRAARAAARPPAAPPSLPPQAGEASLASPRRLPPRPRLIVNGRPTAAHPWRHSGLRRQAG